VDIFLSILVPVLFASLFALLILPVVWGRSNRTEIDRLTAKIQRDERAFRDEFVRIAEEHFDVTCQVKERPSEDRPDDIVAYITVYGLHDDREKEFRALTKEFQYIRTIGAMVNQTSWHPMCHFRVSIDGAEEQTT
jgi:hypothetical protein